MNTILSALINGAIASVLVTAVVGLGMLTAGRLLNAATRDLVWWTVLTVTVILPLFYLPIRLTPRIEAPRPQPAAIDTSTANESLKSADPFPTVTASEAVSNRLRLPIGISAGRLPQWAGTVWLVTSVFMLIRLALSAVA